jgi:hypothetical protein
MFRRFIDSTLLGSFWNKDLDTLKDRRKEETKDRSSFHEIDPSNVNLCKGT